MWGHGAPVLLLAEEELKRAWLNVGIRVEYVLIVPVPILSLQLSRSAIPMLVCASLRTKLTV
jgi:hypothetical protein